MVASPRTSARRIKVSGRRGPCVALYDTLLHELGHLQIVGNPGAWDGEFASEGLAQDFANEWRGRLYSEPFTHSDPVHNAPTDEERAMLPFWEALDKPHRERVTELVVCGGLRSLGFDGVKRSLVYWKPD